MSASPMLPQKVAEHGGGVLEHTMQLSDLPERVFGSLEEMAYPGFFRAYLHLVAAYIQPLGILEVSCLCSLSAVTVTHDACRFASCGYCRSCPVILVGMTLCLTPSATVLRA